MSYWIPRQKQPLNSDANNSWSGTIYFGGGIICPTGINWSEQMIVGRSQIENLRSILLFIPNVRLDTKTKLMFGGIF